MNVIFGASGFAKETFLICRRLNKANNTVANNIDYFVVDDKDTRSEATLHGIPIIGESSFFNQFQNLEISAYIAIGSPAIRKSIVEKISRWNTKVNFPPLVDPSAIMDEDVGRVILDEGVIICAGVIMTTDIKIGRFTHINLDTTVGHDVEISSFTTLSPGCHISGKVSIGSCVFCGTGAVILENLSIADKTTLGAAGVVVKNITESGVYVGIPAKRMN